MDSFTSERRSEHMARIRQKRTRPEIQVQKILREKRLSFRANKAGLPGTPDLVLERQKLVIFVHGCFWHGHNACRYATIPKTRTAFWIEKIKNNKARDRRKARSLRKLGWNVRTIWECETRTPEKLKRKLETITNLSSLKNESL